LDPGFKVCVSNATGQVDSISFNMEELADLGTIFGLKFDATFHIFYEHFSSSIGIYFNFYLRMR
jgi:hypothetical protein